MSFEASRRKKVSVAVSTRSLHAFALLVREVASF